MLIVLPSNFGRGNCGAKSHDASRHDGVHFPLAERRRIAYCFVRPPDGVQLVTGSLVFLPPPGVLRFAPQTSFDVFDRLRMTQPSFDGDENVFPCSRWPVSSPALRVLSQESCE